MMASKEADLFLISFCDIARGTRQTRSVQLRHAPMAVVLVMGMPMMLMSTVPKKYAESLSLGQCIAICRLCQFWRHMSDHGPGGGAILSTRLLLPWMPPSLSQRRRPQLPLNYQVMLPAIVSEHSSCGKMRRNGSRLN